MSARTHNFRIGLVVLIGALLFIGALFAMGLRSYFGERDVYETYLTGHVENLSVGALVKLRGVTIGKVKSIDFISTEYPEHNEDAVVVCFETPKNFKWSGEGGDVQGMLDHEIARGLRARVESQGFLGAGIVSLEYIDPTMYPVVPMAWTPKHYYIPSAPSQFNHILTAVEKSLVHVEDLDVTNLLARAQQLIDSANTLVANINRVDFNQLGTNANALVAEFRETNRGIQKTLTDAQGALHDADLAGIRRDTGVLEAKLTSAVGDLQRLLGNINAGPLNDSLENVRDATDELIVLLHRLQQQPSSVLFSKPPPPSADMDKPPKK
jgi:ABC-type transporter Mla subunit MlaD